MATFREHGSGSEMEHVPTLNLVGVCTLCTACWTRRRSHSISIRSVISIPCSTKLILHITSISKNAASSSALFLYALQILDDFYVNFGSEVIFLAQNVYPMPALVTVPLDALAICTSDGYRTNPSNAYGRGMTMR